MQKVKIRGHRRTIIGNVIGKSGEKTIKVVYQYKVPHPIYKKEIRRKTVVYAHDDANKCKNGDVVRIFETRPLSKLKRWKVESVVCAVEETVV